MDRSGNRLVVLVDGADVRHVFSSWPPDICLAVCLDASGDCTMIVFHREERPGIAGPVLQRLGWTADEASFVPKVEGFRTRQFLYSDERRLMVLVSSNADILEEAHDYAVNYTYALEEGLDPLILVGQQPADDAPLAEDEDISEHLGTAGVPDFLRRSPDSAKRVKFASIRKAGLTALTG